MTICKQWRRGTPKGRLLSGWGLLVGLHTWSGQGPGDTRSKAEHNGPLLRRTSEPGTSHGESAGHKGRFLPGHPGFVRLPTPAQVLKWQNL